MLLQLNGVSKSFNGLKALKEIDLAINQGEIRGLIGPNGSGKTTLFNIITGLIKPDEGKITFDGTVINLLTPNQRCQKGIARTFQIPKPFARMSPLENVIVGRIYGSHPARTMKEAREEANVILYLTGLKENLPPLASMLSLVDRKRLEVARALATKPKLLLLDEIIAGLNPKESEEIIQLILEVRDSGTTIIFVEHVIKAVLKVSDQVTVLNAGEKIAEGTTEEIFHHEEVIKAYWGEKKYA